jgi:hypothetical protein
MLVYGENKMSSLNEEKNKAWEIKLKYILHSLRDEVERLQGSCGYTLPTARIEELEKVY